MTVEAIRLTIGFFPGKMSFPAGTTMEDAVGQHTDRSRYIFHIKRLLNDQRQNDNAEVAGGNKIR